MNEQEPNYYNPEAQEQVDSLSPEAPAAAEPMAPDCQDCPLRDDQSSTDGGDQLADQPVSDKPDDAQDQQANDKPDDQDHSNQDAHLRPEECQRTCRRNFWTEVLRAIVKVSTLVLAALGLSTYGDPSSTQ